VLTYLLVAFVLLIATGIAPRFAQTYGSLLFAAFVVYLALATEPRRRHLRDYHDIRVTEGERSRLPSSGERTPLRARCGASLQCSEK